MEKGKEGGSSTGAEVYIIESLRSLSYSSSCWYSSLSHFILLDHTNDLNSAIGIQEHT